MVNFIKYRKIYFVFSGVILSSFLISLLLFSLRPGIDLAGGSILEIEYKIERPPLKEISKKLEKLNLGEFYLQASGEKGLILRIGEIKEEKHQEILDVLGRENLEEKKFELVGGVVGKELRNKAKLIIILTIFLISFYIIFAFREISRKIKPWQYTLSVLLCLLHDILIPLGIFSLLGRFFGLQITIPIIVALLTILGYDINNIIVVFDRIRENLKKKRNLELEKNLNLSINQTLSRQINTSLTTLFPLIFIYFFSTETLKYFSLTLIIGIITGLYSSIFLASSILYSLVKSRQLAKP
jgi:preprotein translocase subunit SecF